MKFALADMARDSGIRHTVNIHLIEASGGKPEELKDATKNCNRDEQP
jgi:hypothetical protein